MNLFAAEIQRSVNGRPGGLEALSEDDIFRAVERTHLRVEGSYSVIAMITGWGLIALRDPHGIRPLFMGLCENEGFTERIFASESVACSALGFTPERDIAPGEAVIARVTAHSPPSSATQNQATLLVSSNMCTSPALTLP